MQESDRGNVAFLKFQLHISTFFVCLFASSMLADDLKLSSMCLQKTQVSFKSV